MGDKKVRGLRAKCAFYDDFITANVISDEELGKIVEPYMKKDVDIKPEEEPFNIKYSANISSGRMKELFYELDN